MLEGTVSQSWLTGENQEILPTETQKNTCYALALETEFVSPEDYGLALARDILSRHHHLSAVNIEIQERTWERVNVGGKPHNHVFMTGTEPIRRTCRVRVPRQGQASCTSGVREIKIMKTTQSGFDGFIKDKYTNLQPVGPGTQYPDRIMCTQMVAEWTYAAPLPENKFSALNERILSTLMEEFAGPADEGKFSKSLQVTCYDMATQVLRAFPEVDEVYTETPNVHFYPYNLEQFGLRNPNIVFQSTDAKTTASGRIVTRLGRKPPAARL
mmetsp:Transcript_71331/g.168130  ORF Transcript_71331/g.168130 Transcript_71331/m.168130 type:complete len:270 (-) Transcript_71331:59-868(-)